MTSPYVLRYSEIYCACFNMKRNDAKTNLQCHVHVTRYIYRGTIAISYSRLILYYIAFTIARSFKVKSLYLPLHTQ